MLTCAILDDYQGVATRFGDFDRLKGRVQVTVFREAIADAAALAPFDIIVAMRERTAFDAARLAALPALKLLVTTGMRNAAIDIAAAERRGLPVCGTEGFAGSTAELAWGLLLSLTRNIPFEANALRNGAPWQTTVGRDLNGMTLGVVGLGKLGARVASYGRAFGMNVLGWSRNNTPERAAALGVTLAPDLDGLLAQSDVVSLHLVLNGETRGIIDARRLALMKPDALLLNTARGPLVEEAALIAALAAGRIGGAGLDVYDHEPLAQDHPFRTLPNVVATPHLGYVTDNSYRVFYGGVVESIEAWLAGKPIRLLTAKA